MDADFRFSLSDADICFPNPLSVKDDVIAVGGNLEPPMLLSAYKQGIFPWFSEDEPIIWWSLDPRFVIVPSRLHLSKSLRKSIRGNPFHLTLDDSFEEVVRGCRSARRPGQDGTWITDSMAEAYTVLHREGFAHSVEAWYEGKLAGGLYGVSLGGCFYGESMFSLRPNASKIAFAALGGILTDAGFGLIDCQQHTRHLASFGAFDMRREVFLEVLGKELEKPTLRGDWSGRFPDFPASNLWNGIRTKAEKGKAEEPEAGRNCMASDLFPRESLPPASRNPGSAVNR